MPVHIQEHESAKKRYLLALLEKAEADEKAESTGIPCLEEREIAEHIDLANPTVRRISMELEAEGLITYLGGMGEYRVIYALSIEGRKRAEQARYEKTPLAKRRKLTATAGQSITEAAKSGLGKILSLAAGAAAAAIAAWWHWDKISEWLGSLFHL